MSTAVIGKNKYDLDNPAQRERYWNEVARQSLVGQKIVAVNYISTEEAEKMGWSNRGVVIELSNGTQLMPFSDDEGNDAGALSMDPAPGKKLISNILPVLYG